MKTRMILAGFLLFSFVGTGAMANTDMVGSSKPPAPKGCKPNCDGIPAGKCSCVSIDHYTCCGLRTDGLTTKGNKEQQTPDNNLKTY